MKKTSASGLNLSAANYRAKPKLFKMLGPDGPRRLKNKLSLLDVEKDNVDCGERKRNSWSTLEAQYRLWLKKVQTGWQTRQRQRKTDVGDLIEIQVPRLQGKCSKMPEQGHSRQAVRRVDSKRCKAVCTGPKANKRQATRSRLMAQLV